MLNNVKYKLDKWTNNNKDYFLLCGNTGTGKLEFATKWTCAQFEPKHIAIITYRDFPFDPRKYDKDILFTGTPHFFKRYQIEHPNSEISILIIDMAQKINTFTLDMIKNYYDGRIIYCVDQKYQYVYGELRNLLLSKKNDCFALMNEIPIKYKKYSIMLILYMLNKYDKTDMHNFYHYLKKLSFTLDSIEYWKNNSHDYFVKNLEKILSRDSCVICDNYNLRKQVNLFGYFYNIIKYKYKQNKKFCNADLVFQKMIALRDAPAINIERGEFVKCTKIRRVQFTLKCKKDKYRNCNMMKIEDRFGKERNALIFDYFRLAKSYDWNTMNLYTYKVTKKVNPSAELDKWCGYPDIIPVDFGYACSKNVLSKQYDNVYVFVNNDNFTTMTYLASLKARKSIVFLEECDFVFDIISLERELNKSQNLQNEDNTRKFRNLQNEDNTCEVKNINF